MSRVISVRQELLERASDSPRLEEEDYERFNSLLSAARRERPRDPILLGPSELRPGQDIDRAELIQRYNRLALGMGERGEPPPRAARLRRDE